jgi:hypothetical protein
MNSSTSLHLLLEPSNETGDCMETHKSVRAKQSYVTQSTENSTFPLLMLIGKQVRKQRPNSSGVLYLVDL